MGMLFLGLAPQLTLAAATKASLTNASKTEQPNSEKNGIQMLRNFLNSQKNEISSPNTTLIVMEAILLKRLKVADTIRIQKENGKIFPIKLFPPQNQALI